MHILLNSGPLKYFQTILVGLICPTLGVVDFLSALNLMVEKKIGRTAINFHPFFILLGAAPDSLR